MKSMLYYLYDWLAESNIPGIGMFQYISFGRAVQSFFAFYHHSFRKKNDQVFCKKANW
jgi:hypothetical protein